MAFMFETRLPQLVTEFAAHHDSLQKNYINCWDGLEKKFNGTIEGKK
jgi:homogentisate 1,2-dioxygenase